MQREPAITPPFLPTYRAAREPDFPVVISDRAAQRLYWHVIEYSQAGIGLLFHNNAGIQDVEYADAGRLDKTEYRTSHFGRIPIAIHRTHETSLRGFMLDIKTFPPGPPNLHLIEMEEGLWPEASNPGRLTLSTKLLSRFHPELFQSAGPLVRTLASLLRFTSQFGAKPGDTTWIHRWIGIHDPDGQCQVIERLAEHIWRGDANPALVVDTNPLTIAAYSPDIDNVMLLRLPKETQQHLSTDLRVGTRLVTCNTYGMLSTELADMARGPNAKGFWTNCTCVIAGLITEDKDRLEELKGSFSDSAWQACRQRANERLRERPLCRDGRPNYAWIPTVWQSLPHFRVRGGYCR